MIKFVVLAIVLLATSAHAQSCLRFGGLITCDNGASSFSIGNTLIYNTPPTTPPSAAIILPSGVTATQLGNTTYFNNGLNAQTFGNTTYFNNGMSCVTVGNTTYCN